MVISYKVIKSHLITPWSEVLLEKLNGFQPVKKFPVFYGTWRFITAFTSAHHLSLSSASSIQSMSPHPTFWRSILILPSHLLLRLPSGLFPSGFPTKTLYTTQLDLTAFTILAQQLHLQLSSKVNVSKYPCGVIFWIFVSVVCICCKMFELNLV